MHALLSCQLPSGHSLLMWLWWTLQTSTWTLKTCRLRVWRHTVVSQALQHCTIYSTFSYVLCVYIYIFLAFIWCVVFRGISFRTLMEASGVHSSCEVVLQKISIVIGLHPYIRHTSAFFLRTTLHRKAGSSHSSQTSAFSNLKLRCILLIWQDTGSCRISWCSWTQLVKACTGSPHLHFKKRNSQCKGFVSCCHTGIVYFLCG